METLYVIRLQNNKWYIGKTKNYNHRMDQHVDAKGAQWTKKYSPSQDCSVLGQYNDATWEETKKTLEFMCEKGLNNVRGGEYCQIADFTEGDAIRISWAVSHHLGRDQKSSLTKLLAGMYSQKKLDETNSSESSSISKRKRDSDLFTDSKLILQLREVRKQIADTEKLPVFQVFKNAAIVQMVVEKPTCEQEFLLIHGVGPVNFKKYGQPFLNCIQEYLRTHCRICDGSILDNPSKPLCLDCYRKNKK